MVAALSPTKVLEEADQFTNFGNKRYIYVDGATAAQNYKTLTKAQLNAGVDITNLVNAVTGFDETTNWIDSTNAGSGRTGKVAGRRSSGDSSIKFNTDLDGPTGDARSIFTTVLQRGVVAIFPTGYDDAADLYDAWAVQVGSISSDEDVEALQSLTVSFGISKSPARALAIPTT
jgi:hypothetical protein